MAHIFISYSKLNKDYARKLADKLLALGFDVWIDDRVNYGTDWWRTIVEAIRGCGAFVVIMSPESDDSRWVQREVGIADELQKPMFPILLAGDLLTSKHWLMFVRTQYADARGGRLPDGNFYHRLEQTTERHDLRGTDLVGSQMPPEDHSPPDASRVLPAPFEWCAISSGSVTLADASSDGGSRGGKRRVEHFFIAKFPVTNAQFAVFAADPDGYANPRWWDFMVLARAWRNRNGHAHPPEFDGADLPRTQVNWFEAMAFCNWLTAQLRAHDVPPDAPLVGARQVVSLPSEEQWQRAAQGSDDRGYPWGSDFDQDKTNTRETNYCKPTPVGKYRQGGSPYGVIDMSGNIWEWCSTPWTLDKETRFALRGGSFAFGSRYARVTTRESDQPDNLSEDIGFRVALVVVGS